MREIEKFCVDCGKAFMAKNQSAKRCPECSALRYRARLDAANKKYQARQEARAKEFKDVANLKTGDRRVCPQCGLKYTVDLGHGKVAFCSMTCLREWNEAHEKEKEDSENGD